MKRFIVVLLALGALAAVAQAAIQSEHVRRTAGMRRRAPNKINILY
jgi:hypothetical protein